VQIDKVEINKKARSIAADIGRAGMETSKRVLGAAKRVKQQRDAEAPSKNDAFLQWFIFAGVSVFAFLMLWFYGLLQSVIMGDPTYISLIILLAYFATSAHCAYRAFVLSREAHAAEQVDALVKAGAMDALPDCAVTTHINDITQKAELLGGGRLDQSILLRVLAERLRGSNNVGIFASDSLMKLGLFGTIVGFIMMLAPIANIDTENAALLKSSMSAMGDGMSVAMYTTLTGLVCSLLVKVQYAIVETATSNIFTSAVELTEVHVVSILNQEGALKRD